MNYVNTLYGLIHSKEAVDFDIRFPHFHIDDVLTIQKGKKKKPNEDIGKIVHSTWAQFDLAYHHLKEAKLHQDTDERVWLTSVHLVPIVPCNWND